ncbi:hypothetical protein BDN70DRAFT_932438 [Pholiota conissans]|uniref:Uncharacterized protein n=1 Tax=Pholiota conissans TaxID=109636 RepID=A0A9P5Z2R0_9AGAR|nr:hypothetical protein BDN70DRAFT_932438 [Pholiota conissans]
MPFLNGFNASVIVPPDRVLQSYGIVIDEAKRTLTCWIPSEAGQPYKIVWGCVKHFMDSRGDVFIDGRPVGSELIHHSYMVKMDDELLMVAKDRSTLDNSGPFTFPKSSDDAGEQNMEADTEDSMHIADLEPFKGEICLIIHRTVIHRITHLVSVDPQARDERIATFVFKYRSIDFLKKNGIDLQDTHIIPLRIRDLDAPMEQETSEGQRLALNNKSEQTDVYMRNVDDAQLDSKICELQEELNALYAKKVIKERLVYKLMMHDHKPSVIAKRKLAEELRLLDNSDSPRSIRRRERKIKAASEALERAKLEHSEGFSAPNEGSSATQKPPRRKSLRAQTWKAALEAEKMAKLNSQPSGLDDEPSV